MHIAFVADIGGRDTYHVGDEAMLAANLQQLHRLFPASRFTLFSKDPAFSACEYGVDAVEALGFENLASSEDRERRLGLVGERGGEPSIDRVAERLSSCDALIISGGGNLAAARPNLVYERAAFCRMAGAAGVPVILLGQTIGPALSGREKELVAEILGSAVWIGAREVYSYALACTLRQSCDAIVYQEDDALVLDEEPLAPEQDQILRQLGDRVIGLTIHPVVDPSNGSLALARLADQLRQIQAATSCGLVFLPHAEAAPRSGAPLGDLAIAEALARYLDGATYRILPVLKAAQAKAVYRSLEGVISSRYHPIVFGLGAGVPSLAIPTDGYTSVKLHGALRHFGRDDDACDWNEALGGLAGRFLEMWSGRAELSAALRRRATAIAERAAGRWECLGRLLQGTASTPRSGSDEVWGDLAIALIRSRSSDAYLRMADARHILELERERRNALTYIKSLEQELGKLRRNLADAGRRGATS